MSEMNDKGEYLLFYGHRPSPDGTITESCLSQWYECRFVEDGITYHTAEQYMMARKARLFGDDSAFRRIMNAQTPKECKRIGRTVQSFSDPIWQIKRYEIVAAGNLLKFRQNEDLKRFLLGTGNKVLVEASPYDRVWGIGMSANDPDAADPQKWRGQNLLGRTLMLVRDILRKESRS